MKKTEYFSYRNSGSLAAENGIENVIKMRNEFLTKNEKTIITIEKEDIQFVVLGNNVTTVLSLTYITN